jgi:hypothetical protein
MTYLGGFAFDLFSALVQSVLPGAQLQIQNARVFVLRREILQNNVLQIRKSKQIN